MRASHLLSPIVFLGLVLVGASSASAVPIAVTEPEVTDTITVGSQPFLPLLNADETTLYVSNDQSGTVSVIDTATNAVTATIVVGQNPVPPVLHPAGTRVQFVWNRYEKLEV